MKKRCVIPALAILLIILLPGADAVKYCVGNELHENITVNGNVVHIIIDNCSFGCSDTTLITLGNTGCIESDLTIWIILMFVVIGLVLLFKWMRKT